MKDCSRSRQQTIPIMLFRFIDLFAGIGGIRHGFEAIGGQCVFTSEWNSYSVKNL
uniref:DNA-cytosine methyltransferase n=1 Tax=Klebsiella pneumoniae TaxID=573 RepID=A0A8B0ST72_KLEPN|nr:DNA-cytosine methyltransferase [Klebsiella pneumoniae]